MSRLKDKYQQEVVPALTKEFGYKNVMAVPRIHKVVVNMGLGEATANTALTDRLVALGARGPVPGSIGLSRRRWPDTAVPFPKLGVPPPKKKAPAPLPA